jgi:type VI secretion system secreted protein Hcp
VGIGGSGNVGSMTGGAGDLFMKIKGAKHGPIKGESQDTDHKDEIEVMSWSWGMEAKQAIGGGGATGKATIRELKIVKKVDAASTALMLALRTNELIQSAVLTARKAGKGQHEYLKVSIEGGRVTGLDIQVNPATSNAELVEHVSFSFNKIEVEYTPQGPDGQPRGSTIFSDQWAAS